MDPLELPKELDANIRVFHGKIERMESDFAHVTLQSPGGEELLGKCRRTILDENGIGEGDRFELTLARKNGTLKYEIKKVTRGVVSAEECQKLWDRFADLND